MDIRPPTLPSVRVPEKEKQEKPEEVRGKSSPLFALKDAVTQNAEAEAALSKITDASLVEQANQEAASSEVRDVERAADLAKGVAKRIRQNPEQAKEAQANQRPDDVRKLLG